MISSPPRQGSQRFPHKLLLNLMPVAAARLFRYELHLLLLRVVHHGVPLRFRHARELLVNVGCGPNGLAGWVNIDCGGADGVTLVRDCRKSLALPTDSVRGIFTEHFVEHLDYYDEAPQFFSECLRVLRPHGVIRVIVPDGEKYLNAYCSDGWEQMSFSPLPRAYESTGSSFRSKMEVVNAHFRQGGQHRFSYDYETLARLLEDVGFVQIEHRAFRSSMLKDLEIDSEVRAAESLVVEGVCPESPLPDRSA